MNRSGIDVSYSYDEKMGEGKETAVADDSRNWKEEEKAIEVVIL